MQIKHHNGDLFPYQQSFAKWLVEEETINEETLVDYQKILKNFFFDLEQISLLFARNKQITQVSAEDIALYFQNIRDTYSHSRFNKIHTVITRYYKFLIIHRINVPPFPWTVKTEQIRRNFDLPHYDWEEFSQLAQTIDIKEPTSETNEWINLIAKVIFILFSKGFTISQIASSEIKELLDQINLNPQEKRNIDKACAINSDYLVCKKNGQPYGKTQILIFLNELLKVFGLKEKKGRLTEDARVAYIVKENLRPRDIAYLYELKAHGQIIERLMNYAQNRTQMEETPVPNS